MDVETPRLSYTLGEIAGWVDGTLADPSQSETRITGISGIREAGEGDITFVSSGKYVHLVSETGASAVIVQAKQELETDLPLLRVKSPDQAFARISEAFAPPPIVFSEGVHASAVISPDAIVAPDVKVGPHCVVEAGARIGAGTILMAGVYVGHEVSVGKNVFLYPRVVLRERVEIGDRVIIHAGTVVGCDGFGYATVKGVHHKIPQTGTVQICEDVEIGANVTIDRARFDLTRIGRGTKIDNLVQIGHNVMIGEGCLLAAQIGIAGSTRIGNYVVIGGQAGITGHATIGDGAMIGAQSGVTKSVNPGTMVSGYPAKEHLKQRKEHVLVRKLPDLSQKVKELEGELAQLRTSMKENAVESANDSDTGHS